MRANKKFGVLSDQYIKENYADCFLPIAVDKLHAIRQKPAHSYVNTSGKRIKEYNSIAPVIPQFIAENNIKKLGIPGQEEVYAIKSDLIRRAASAKSNYSILQPPRKRQGALQQDLGFAQISSMANAQDPDYGEIEPEFVADQLDAQAPLGSSGLRASFNTMLGMQASRAKEDMSFAGKGVKPDLAEILDPSIITKMYIVGELQRQPESALFVKPQKGKQIQQQQTDLLPTDEITDQAKTMGTYQSAPAPPPQAPIAPPVQAPIAPPVQPPPTPVKPPVSSGTSTQPVMEIKGQVIEYADINISNKLSSTDVPKASDDIFIIKEFLAKYLRTDNIKTQKGMEQFLSQGNKSGDKKPTAKVIKDILRKYFPKSAGRPSTSGKIISVKRKY
jgi:hypothetical protein